MGASPPRPRGPVGGEAAVRMGEPAMGMREAAVGMGKPARGMGKAAARPPRSYAAGR